MAYIGREPQIGNFQVCDAISVVNGQAAYTMQVDSTNVVPETANHCLVSLNGILQKPGSSFTVSSSTLTFASNLVTNDVIDFVVILGSVLDLGTPSDSTVTTAKLAANSVTGAKLNTDVISAQTALTSSPADTDELLISDAGTLKRIDVSLVGGKMTPAFFAISTQTEDNTDISDDPFVKMTFSTEIFDTDYTFDNSTNHRFTPGVAGKYMITAKGSATNQKNADECKLAIYKNGSIMESASGTRYGVYTSYFEHDVYSNDMYTMTLNVIVDADADDYYEIYGVKHDGGNTGGMADKYFGAFRIIGA